MVPMGLAAGVKGQGYGLRRRHIQNPGGRHPNAGNQLDHIRYKIWIINAGRRAETGPRLWKISNAYFSILIRKQWQVIASFKIS